MYGEERLQACLNSSTQRGAHDYLALAFSAVEEFAAGAEQSDDITVLAISRHVR
jgi:serine phosphatase RsbU (regulator of sigma subunit)